MATDPKDAVSSPTNVNTDYLPLNEKKMANGNVNNCPLNDSGVNEIQNHSDTPSTPKANTPNPVHEKSPPDETNSSISRTLLPCNQVRKLNYEICSYSSFSANYIPE